MRETDNWSLETRTGVVINDNVNIITIDPGSGQPEGQALLTPKGTWHYIIYHRKGSELKRRPGGTGSAADKRGAVGAMLKSLGLPRYSQLRTKRLFRKEVPDGRA